MTSTKFCHQCITEYVQVQQGHVVQLQLHPINCNSSSSSSSSSKPNQICQSRSWFKDRHLQEVIQLIKVPLCKRFEALASIADKTKKDKPAVYNILSGNTIRLAYTFKKNPSRQYFLVMNDSKTDFEQFQDFCLKNEKMVVFICQIEKGIENLMKAVNDTERLTSSEQTVNISSYFFPLPQNSTRNSEESLDNLEKKDSSDVCSSDSSKKEKLRSIVSRVKRLRQKRSKYKSYPRFVERNSSEKLSSPENPIPDAGGQTELPNFQLSDILKESNHALKQNATPDCGTENLSFNLASLSDSLVSFQSDQDSDGSTSSDENLPYYGISDKCSAPGTTENTSKASSVANLSGISNALESEQNADPHLNSDQSSPAKFSACSAKGISAWANISPVGEGKGKKAQPRRKKGALKTGRDKELAKPGDSKDASKLGLLNVHDLTTKQIMRLIKRSENYLRKIFEGKTTSWRHNMYKTGGPERHRLNFQCQFGNLSPKQLEIVMEGLFNIFCKKHLKYEDYVSKVMLAEAIIKIHMDIYQISHQEAEKMLQ